MNETLERILEVYENNVDCGNCPFYADCRKSMGTIDNDSCAEYLLRLIIKEEAKKYT